MGRSYDCDGDDVEGEEDEPCGFSSVLPSSSMPVIMGSSLSSADKEIDNERAGIRIENI